MTQSQRNGMAGLIFIIGVHEHINENKSVSAVSADKNTSWHMQLFVIYITVQRI
jgi:hypothetical protein